MFAAAQVFTFGALPGQAAQNGCPEAHWVQTGALLGAGFCTTKHRKHHYVRALGDHYAGKGRCVRNGPWWTGRRSVEWGPYYEPRNQSGSVTFEGPHGERLKLESRVPSAMA